MLREKRFVVAGADETLNWQGRLFWLGVASASFHLAYLIPGGVLSDAAHMHRRSCVP